MPSRALLKVGSPESEVPPNSISPSSYRSCPHTQLNRVVFPAPLGPTRPTLSPAFRWKEMSCTAWMPPNDLDTLRRDNSGASGIGLRNDIPRMHRVILLREEALLEPQVGTPLLKFEYPLRVFGELQRSERKERSEEHT